MRETRRGPGAGERDKMRERDNPRERDNMMRIVLLLTACASLALLLMTCNKSDGACCCQYCKADQIACGNVCQAKNLDCAWPPNSGCACEQGSPRRPCKAEQGIGDLPACRRPPGISDCDAPPNKASTKYYYCWGCNCSGATPVAACNGFNGDCRYFADGCYPKSYTLCDQNAPDNILGLCGYCFFREAGPGHCDRLVEAGAAPKDLGGKLH